MPSGHVAKKGKNWYVVLELENEDGERKRKWISVKKELGLPKRATKAQAEELLNKYLRDLYDGNYIEPTEITVKEYLEQWTENYVKHNVKPTTYGTYKNAVNKHIIPSLGKIKLAKLRKSQIKGFLAEKQKSGMSSYTISNIFFVLKSALKHAVEDELIRRNPAEGITLISKKKTDIKYWEQEQAKKFLDCLKNDKHPQYALYLLALATGMRRGELLGLKWENINFKKRTIKIVNSYVHTDEGDILQDSTKSGKSRTIHNIPLALLEVLQEHKKNQKAQLLALGRPEKDMGLVFTTSKGTPISPRNFERQFKSLIKKYKLPPLSPHGLRHTAATRMLEDGIDVKTVAEILGHADASVLLNVYSHVTPKMRKQAAESMESLL